MIEPGWASVSDLPTQEENSPRVPNAVSETVPDPVSVKLDLRTLLHCWDFFGHSSLAKLLAFLLGFAWLLDLIREGVTTIDFA